MALFIPPVDRKLLTSTDPFGIHPPELIQTVQCQGQRLSWPSPSYNFKGIYDTLFVLPTPASAPGTVVIRSHLRRKGNALDNRGAGPYGPQGLLWILAALRRRAQIMQLSPQQLSSLCRTAIPDLASSLLSVDSGLSIENARRQIQDGRAYGHLVFPVDIGCLTNLSPSFQQVHHQQQVQPPALIPLSLSATHPSQTRGTKRAPTSPAESVSKRPTPLPAPGSKGVPAQPVSQQSSKTLVVPTLTAPAARQPPKTVQADPQGVSTLHLSPDTPESPNSANLARSDTIARLLQRATPLPCATSGDRSPAPLAATRASQRESAQADILAAEDDNDISETTLDNFLATYRPNLDPEDSPPPPIGKNTLKGTSPLPVRHRQHSTQGTSTLPILQRQYSSKGTSTLPILHYISQDTSAPTSDRSLPWRSVMADALSDAEAVAAFHRLRFETIARTLSAIQRPTTIDPFQAPPSGLSGIQVPHPSPVAEPRSVRVPVLPGQETVHPGVFGWGEPLVPQTQLYGWMRGPGRYVQSTPIGSGMQATVVKAHDQLFNGSVAIKVVVTGRGRPWPSTVWREVGSLSRIRHQNVVALRDVVLSHHDGAPAMHIVLDFCETDLQQVLASTPRRELAAEVIKTWAREALCGLGAVHKAGIIHFDFKPSNILLTASGTVKIADFGLAEDGSQRSPGVRHHALTALWYRAPEILMRSNRLGAAADVWSWAVVVAEMIGGVGKPLWVVADPVSAMSTIVLSLCDRSVGELWPGSDHLPGPLLDDSLPYNTPRPGPKRFTGGQRSNAILDLVRQLADQRGEGFKNMVQLLEYSFRLNPAIRPSCDHILGHRAWDLWPRVPDPRLQMPRIQQKHSQR